MLAYGVGAYVLHTFALAYLVSAIALWLIGIETKGRVLEQITGDGGLASAVAATGSPVGVPARL